MPNRERTAPTGLTPRKRKHGNRPPLQQTVAATGNHMFQEADFHYRYDQRRARPLPQPSKTTPNRRILAGSGTEG